ncbi:MAG: iron ABC transporter permease [Pseudomonadota bacterium]
MTRRGNRLVPTLALLIAAACLLPMLAVAVAAAMGTLDIVAQLANTVLWRYTYTTLILVVLVGLGSAMIGTGAAWLVTMTRFPGVRVLEIALALPLAFPAYVLAYAYTDLLDHPGAVQTSLRAITGWGARDYWFPEIRSVGGAALMLTLVLYPYVYLLVRAAFLQQSGTAYLAARALGQSAWGAFWRVSLPVARPAIAGGALLAIMETIADFGTVSFFGVQTFATGIYVSWIGVGDRAAAAQLALCLLLFALLLAMLERSQRGEARHHNTGKRFETVPEITLHGRAAWLATGLCAVPVLLGFVLPVGLLIELGIGSEQDLTSRRYVGFIQNSLTLAGTACLVTGAAAITLALYHRLAQSRLSSTATYIARIGYAVPGGVIAVGLMVPFARLDNAIDAFSEARFGIDTGLLFTGSIWVLVIAYMVRFLAAALNTYDSGLAVVHPNMDAVARTLGAAPVTMLRRVHLPILTPSLLTALLIVFVDVMKELPATLIMRPFNYDTLAVQAHRLASDERLEGAAVPSLVIVAVGLLPVILICRQVGLRSKTARRNTPAPSPAEV